MILSQMVMPILLLAIPAQICLCKFFTYIYYLLFIIYIIDFYKRPTLSLFSGGKKQTSSSSPESLQLLSPFTQAPIKKVGPDSKSVFFCTKQYIVNIFFIIGTLEKMGST